MRPGRQVGIQHWESPAHPPSVSLLSPGGGRLHSSSPAACQRASHSGNTAPFTALSCSAQFAFKQVSFHLLQGSGERRTLKRLVAIPGSQRDQGWTGGRGGPGTILGVAEHTRHRAGMVTQSAGPQILPAGGPREAFLALVCLQRGCPTGFRSYLSLAFWGPDPLHLLLPCPSE